MALDPTDMVVTWHLVPPWPPTPLALDHELQNVRIGDGMAIHHPHDLRTQQPHPEHTKSSPPPLNPFVMCLHYLTTTHDLPSIMLALFEPLCWQGGGMSLIGDSTATGGMYLGDGSTATVSSTSYTSCSADLVSGCTWGPPTAYSQTMSLMSKSGSGLWLPTHTSTHSSIFSSPPLTHTPHPNPRHVACGCACLLCALLVTVVHVCWALCLHDQSIRHGTHCGGLASRATMTTNTFGSGSWTSVCTYRGWDGSTPSTRLEYGSLTHAEHTISSSPHLTFRRTPSLRHHHLMTYGRSC